MNRLAFGYAAASSKSKPNLRRAKCLSLRPHPLKGSNPIAYSLELCTCFDAISLSASREYLHFIFTHVTSSWSLGGGVEIALIMLVAASL